MSAKTIVLKQATSGPLESRGWRTDLFAERARRCRVHGRRRRPAAGRSFAPAAWSNASPQSGALKSSASGRLVAADWHASTKVPVLEWVSMDGMIAFGAEDGTHSPACERVAKDPVVSSADRTLQVPLVIAGKRLRSR